MQLFANLIHLKSKPLLCHIFMSSMYPHLHVHRNPCPLPSLILDRILKWRRQSNPTQDGVDASMAPPCFSPHFSSTYSSLAYYISSSIYHYYFLCFFAGDKNTSNLPPCFQVSLPAVLWFCTYHNQPSCYICCQKCQQHSNTTPAVSRSKCTIRIICE